ncbi:MAG TPA: hypothetical protein PK530_25050, partial [Anaerolineales bacterium]|nr:hypothetical protein [Anaerolineales bacterium]
MWTYRHALEPTWKPVQIPSAWEEMGLAKDDPGPYWFHTSFSIPAYEPKKRYWLRFHAVSYYCEIFVNGIRLGEHLGAWDSFSVE